MRIAIIIQLPKNMDVTAFINVKNQTSFFWIFSALLYAMA